MAFNDVLAEFKEAVNAGESPDNRISEYFISVLGGERVRRALFPRRKGRPESLEVFERDLTLSCEVVRSKRYAETTGHLLSEQDAIWQTAENHGVSDSLVKKAYGVYRKAAQQIETPIGLLKSE